MDQCDQVVVRVNDKRPPRRSRYRLVSKYAKLRRSVNVLGLGTKKKRNGVTDTSQNSSFPRDEVEVDGPMIFRHQEVIT